MMKNSTIKSVNDKVYKRYPELNGIQPSIRSQSSKGGKSSSSNLYTLTYRHSAVVSGGKRLPVVVRVVCNEIGRVLKISASK